MALIRNAARVARATELRNLAVGSRPDVASDLNRVRHEYLEVDVDLFARGRRGARWVPCPVAGDPQIAARLRRLDRAAYVFKSCLTVLEAAIVCGVTDQAKPSLRADL